MDGPLTEHPGTVIGPYKLLQQIGEGGMGVVFMAEQTEPIQRTVALKIIKPGMDTRQVIARFEAERQALAMMDHPNIARVLDAGTTGESAGQVSPDQIAGLQTHQGQPDVLAARTGRPYFVMELVKGIPIADYSDRQHLTIRQRLELFTQVCQAVQHAHQKGIIHRDLKPTNVLVAEYDNRAVPKVIDFGVAKATAQKLTERTMFTEFGQVIGTVEYMSPEQAKLNQRDIDTRSDIYSLGVLLYELLTGSTPFEQRQLRDAAFDEILRMIREDEPPKPSTRLSASDSLPSIAANRDTEPTRLGKEVSGELDWIVMKAMEKDRNRRYETASALSEDIQRFLANESVLAFPPTALYQLRKFCTRHRWALITASVVLSALLLGTSVATWQAIRANRAMAAAIAEKQRALQSATTAKRVTESLQQMLGLIDPDAASRSILSLSAVRLQVMLGLVRPDDLRGMDYTIEQLIDDYADDLDEKLQDEPAAAADMHATIGRAYACRGYREKASRHLECALALGRSVYGEDHERYADLLVDYARPDGSDPLQRAEREADLRRALSIYRARGIGGEPVIRALWTLQWSLVEQGYAGSPEKWDQIEPVVNEALAEAAKWPGVDFPKLASIYSGLAGVKLRQSRYADAESIAREAVEMHLRSHPESLEAAWGYYTLGDVLRTRGKFTEALEAEKKVLTMMRRVLPPEHGNIAVASTAVVDTLAMADKSNALLTLIPSVAGMTELESEFREMLEKKPASPLRHDDPRIVVVGLMARFYELYLNLSQELRSAGKMTEADIARQRAIQLFAGLQDELAQNTQLLPYVYYYGAIANTKAAQARQAQELTRNLIERATPQSRDLLNDLAWFLASAKETNHRDPVLAVELAGKAVESDPQSHNYVHTLGVARYRAGEWKQAIADLEKSISLDKGGSSFDFYFLAMAHWQLGNKEQAKEWFTKAVQWMEANQPQNADLVHFRDEARQLMNIAE